MPKMKSSKALKKRVKITARGKVKARKGGHSHLLSNKRQKHLRRLRGTMMIEGSKARTIKEKMQAL
jgi:large subunit ribosomal protein L35